MTPRTKLDSRVCIVYAAILLLASAFLYAPIAQAQQTDHAKKLGLNLMCMCGCAQVLVQCNHLNCPSSAPMLKELDERIATGESDEAVIQDFIKGYGVAVLVLSSKYGIQSRRVALAKHSLRAGTRTHRADH